ncbi:metalloproteinase inhibitor 1 [Crotalus adamanteus]|uniref:Metalloproteinase inhibitor 1 n=1 Tax=Crotalus adamanteus TaxID=8729 RepID=A0AAW1BZH1_CROAD
MLLGDLTESCICVETSPQEACCSAGFVMRAKFMSVMLDPKSPSYFPKNIYTIQPIKVFKGPEELRRAHFLYSPISREYYGYVHKGPLKGDDYIFSVMRVLFLGVQRDPDSPPYLQMNKFSVRVIQVFKGSGRAANARILYSPESVFDCGYKHKGPFQEDDYLISGSFNGNYAEIGKCFFAKPWAQVSERRKMYLSGYAGRDCTEIC